MSHVEVRNWAMELLGLVGLPNVKERLDAWLHQLAGGQRQWVMINMTLAREPNLLMANEPTTTLDVTQDSLHPRTSIWPIYIGIHCHTIWTNRGHPDVSAWPGQTPE